MASASSFSIDVDVGVDVPADQTLLVGLSHPGLGGLTAVDHIARTADTTLLGRVAPEELPAITPFEDGVPRHHTRLYDLSGTDALLLVGELFVPTPAASPFAAALAEWMSEQSVAEMAVFHGIPFPHGPDEHEAFHVVTEPYRERHEGELRTTAMRGGYLDGVAAHLVSRSLDGDAPPTGVFITPTHPPGPDVDAALRFLDVVEAVYGITVARRKLEELSEEIEKYYANLADRMSAIEEQERPGMSSDFRDDRMFM